MTASVSELLAPREMALRVWRLGFGVLGVSFEGGERFLAALQIQNSRNEVVLFSLSCLGLIPISWSLRILLLPAAAAIVVIFPRTSSSWKLGNNMNGGWDPWELYISSNAQA